MKVIYDDSVEKFIKSLEQRTIAKTIRLIELLEEYESNLRMPYSKNIKGNIFELRINSKQEVRILYTFHNDSIILLSGFIKDSNKVPYREIEKAEAKLKKFD